MKSYRLEITLTEDSDEMWEAVNRSDDAGSEVLKVVKSMFEDYGFDVDDVEVVVVSQTVHREMMVSGNFQNVDLLDAVGTVFQETAVRFFDASRDEDRQADARGYEDLLNMLSKAFPAEVKRSLGR